MCFPFWACSCPWGWELPPAIESSLETCSPTARASAVQRQGNEKRQWVRRLVFFSIKREGGLLILPCMHNWYWTWKKGKFGYCFCSYTPAPSGSEHNHICSWFSLQHNWGGEKQMGVGLSKEICFTRFPTLFLPPHGGGFCLLSHGKCQVKCLCVHA